MKSATWFTLAFCGFSASAPVQALSELRQRQPHFAILNLADSTYLQMEVDSLSGGEIPIIDSVKIQYSGAVAESNFPSVLAVANLHVWWTMEITPIGRPPAHVVQITKALPASISAPVWQQGDRVRALRVDTVFSAQSGMSESVRIAGPAHVHNSNVQAPRNCIRNVLCIAEDSIEEHDRLVSDFVEAWKRAGWGGVLQPSQIMTLVYVSPWSQTTGSEDVPGIVVPMVGNRGNWIDIQTQRFSVLKTLPVSESVDSKNAVYNLPTGYVRYVYNRIASPELKILETSESRQIDDILKIGPYLWVEGLSRPSQCGIPLVDTAMHSSSWLVLAASSNDTDVQKSMLPAYRGCNSVGRASAWKVSNDTVWLESKPFRLDELVALAKATSISPKPFVGNRFAARVSRSVSGVSIELSASANVSVRNLEGKAILDAVQLRAGRHDLSIGAARGLILVNIAQGDRSATYPVVR